jgi:translocation and assembly module TamB
MRVGRVIRGILAALLGPPLVVLAGGVAVTLVLLYVPSGRALTARLATDYLTGAVAGQIEIGAFRGGVLRHLVLDDVVIRDSLGATVVRVPHVELRYRLRGLLTGEILLQELYLDRPTVHLVRLRRNRWNYEEVFRTGRGAGGASPRVEVRNLTIRGGTIRVDYPTTPKPPREPISRNAAAPAEPEILASSDGPVRVYRLEELTARLPLVRVSTPNRDPILVRIAELAGRFSDPAVQVVEARGEIVTAGDSLRFTFEHAALPGTRLEGGGAVRWPQDTILFDFALAADTVALADLRFVSPDFPDWQGKGRVVARSQSGSRTDYVLEGLSLGDGSALAVGRLIAMVDARRGLGMRELDLSLREVPVEVMRPYLDTLPVAGTLTGRLRADGFLERLTLGGDLAFRDALAPENPTSQLAFEGPIAFGSAAGAVFDGFQLRGTRLAMPTVTGLVPAVILPGDLRLLGRLDGPWENATFRGTAEHLAPSGALSRMMGAARFDVRGTTLGLDVDLTFDQLSFDALRSGYPELTPRGGLTGRLALRGPIDGVEVDADLTGEIGAIRAIGLAGLEAPRFTADGLILDVRRLDADALLGRGGSTAFNGRILLTGVVDSGASPRGEVILSLGQSRVGGITFSEIAGRLHSDGVMVNADTLLARWPDGRLEAVGSLGWTAPDSGTMRIRGGTRSLAAFDSLARAVLKIGTDTIGPRPLDGDARLAVTLRGAVDGLDVEGTMEADRLVLDRWRGDSVVARFRAENLGRDALTLDVAIDSLGFGDRLIRRVAASVAGRRDSLTFAGGARVLEADITAGGGWATTPERTALTLDSLFLGLPRQRWRLRDPVTIDITENRSVLAAPLRLATDDGGGTLVVEGSLPGNAAGELEASLVGLDLGDIYAMLARDTSAVNGYAALDLRLGGTLERPAFRGNASVTGLVIGETRPPLSRAAFDYQDRRLRSRLALWKTGEPILEVDVSLPVDLALAPRAERKLPGPLEIRATADSADLAILEAFTTSVRNSRGALGLDLQVTGGWGAPRLDGTMAVYEGRTTIPALNVRYGPIIGTGRFVGDSLVVDSLLMSSGEADMVMSGTVRFAQLTRPTLDLTIRSDGFLAADIPNFLTVRPTGTVTLTGPVVQPVLRGQAVLGRTDFYFADLVNKDVINLEDPAFAEFVDRDLLRRENLGAAFQNRFLDSLRIDNLRFSLGNEVWLRSAEANVQLEGAVVVNKVRQDYRIDGEFTALRGTYRLAVGVINRDFTVERGTVRYTGTPDLNADIDISARHVVRTNDGEEIPVVARITGSILVPKLALTSPGRNIPERDLISYLMFGRPEFQVAGGGGGTGDILSSQAIQAAMGILSSEIERTLVQDIGIGLDMFEFRPVITPGSQNAGQFSRLAAGVQLSPRWFVTFNAGFCLGGNQSQQLSARNFGASLEYRFRRDWRIQASAEPVQSCVTSQFGDFGAPLRYQLGADLLWEREY